MPRRRRGPYCGSENAAGEQVTGLSSITAAKSAQARAKAISAQLNVLQPTISL